MAKEEVEITEFKRKANGIRKAIIEMLYRAGSGHPGGSLSICELLTALYFDELRVDPDEPHNPGRDRLILSKGHAAPALYAVLAQKGFFPEEELMRLRKSGSMLQGHPDWRKTPGVDISSGSLGLGVSFGLGVALGARFNGLTYRVWVLTGCGELDEGQNWEAFMAGAKFGLDNLTVIVDYNRLQLDGSNEEIMPLGNLQKKFEAFGWNVLSCNGHDFPEIFASFKAAKDKKGMPSVIIADTVKGKGVSFMEHQCGWHGETVDDQAYINALQELNQINEN